MLFLLLNRRSPAKFYQIGIFMQHTSVQSLLTDHHVCLLFIGTLNVLLRVRGIASVDSLAWTRSGHQGPNWKKAFFDISPSGPFQVQ